ncbi:hypothetical protein HIM_02889 [Hirsutella minnesotensis 3608]|nr:hypothetical protein HIM_02889 [Hirsutella minnesotensis 3608]
MALQAFKDCVLQTRRNTPSALDSGMLQRPARDLPLSPRQFAIPRASQDHQGSAATHDIHEHQSWRFDEDFVRGPIETYLKDIDIDLKMQQRQDVNDHGQSLLTPASDSDLLAMPKQQLSALAQEVSASSTSIESPCTPERSIAWPSKYPSINTDAGVAAGSDIAQQQAKPGPLKLAISNGHLSMVRLLIKHGANVNARGDMGKTALHEAVQANDRNMVEVLADSGADLNAVDSSGSTPLQVAASLGYVEVAEALLRLGADMEHSL